MYAKLDRLRTELEKATRKRDEAEEKVKQLEEKLKKEENQQIVSDVASYNLTPEQLARFLQLADSGKLQELLSGRTAMPEAKEADTAGKEAEDIEDTDTEENLMEEKEEDKENEDY